MTGLVLGLVFGLTHGLGFWRGPGLVLGLMLGLTFGLLLGLIQLELRQPSTEATTPLDPQSLWRRERRFGFGLGLVVGTTGGIADGLVFGPGVGLVFGLTGRVPAVGDLVRFDSIEFRTERVTGRRIQKVLITKAAGAGDAGG